MLKLKVGDVVKKVNTYWYGRLNESRDDIGELYVISKADGAYEIRSLETGGASAWWHDDQLEFVRHEDETIFKKLDKIENDLRNKHNDLSFILNNYPNIPVTSWLKLFDEIGYSSPFLRNGEYFVLFDDIDVLKPLFTKLFNKELDGALKMVEEIFYQKFYDKYKENIKNFYKKICDIQ